MAWLEIDRLARETDAEEVVVDAAPTAHTLRLLAMPESLRRFAEVLDRMQDRHRLMAERFGGAWRPDDSDALISSLETQGREIEEKLRDPQRSALFWVLLPEALSLAETRDALAHLDEAGLPIREVIVNRVLPRDAEMIQEIQETLGDRGLRFLPEEDREPRGREALRRIGKRLAGSARTLTLPTLSLPASPPAAGRERASNREADLAWLDDLAPPTLRLLFFGGKGGVGKTTCAASVALALAKRRPDARVLLLSTDPAHSVADVLEVSLGDDERAVPGAPPGLRARELDPAQAFAAWRDRHSATVGGAVEAFTTEQGGVGDLLDLTPPGLDELIALSTLLDAFEGTFDLVIVDTAPTGHALRLLEMPELALSWDHYLLSLLLKYREAVPLGGLAAELVELSRSLKRLEALLRDAARARFLAVTRDAELPRRETVRLLAALKKLGIAVPAVIVNAVQPDGSRVSPAAFGRCAIMKAPAVFPPPRGVRRLAEWLGTWKKAAE
jgi:arsenite-transporting ATPase